MYCRAFKKALQDMLQSRRAIHNMNTLYPDATADELQQADNVCIICREEMVVNSGVKKLPCNHLFHALCLRSWFQRQQTCPTCRLDVLRPTLAAAAAARAATAAAAPAAPADQQQPQVAPANMG
ncbi:Zinc finger RING-type [Trinorchestia longiramus]|nr:Zinc finger RING-type [Trinorchestia longiramus]